MEGRGFPLLLFSLAEVENLKVKALVSFCGIVTMSKGQVLDIKEKYIYEDLLQAGYVEKVVTRKKSGETNESK